MTLYPNNSTKQVVDNELNKKLKKFDERIENNSSEITSLKSRVSNTEDNITSINGDIEGLEEDIGSLDTRVDTVELALDEKQDTLNFDNAPTSNSDNPVKSGGIYDALETKLDKESVKFDPEPNGTDALSTGGAYDIVQDLNEKIDNVQNQGALLSNDNIDISNNGCLKIDNQQEVETNAIEVLNGDTKLKDTEINGDLSVSGNIDGNVATHSANGLMSSEDKVRLDAIDSSLEDKTVSDTLTDSSSIIPSGKAVSDVIGSLNASSVGGSGKYISEISETNGVITATSEDIDTAVTSGSSKPITSGGVANILSNLPTDAVLHYSFDEVPDYPDGTADVRLLDNNTYQIQSTSYEFSNNGNTTFSNENGNLKFVTVATGFTDGPRLNNDYYNGKIIKLRLNVISLTSGGSIDVFNGVNIDGVGTNIIKSITSVGTYEITLCNINNSYYKGVYIFTSKEATSEVIVEQIYIGDGSYSTPVIDNANGKWNSVSQSGVAVKGVSGKAFRFLGSNYVNGRLPWKPHDKKVFTISCWINNWDNTVALEIINDCISYDIQGNTNILLQFYAKQPFIMLCLPTSEGCIKYQLNDNIFNNIESLMHVVIVSNGNDSCLYINGYKVTFTTTDNITLSDDIMQRQSFQLGKIFDTAYGVYSKADIDDLLIFDRALTETEIKALYYNKANTPKYYNLNNFKLDLIPLPPSTDGTFHLTATVSNGSVSYSWV